MLGMSSGEGKLVTVIVEDFFIQNVAISIVYFLISEKNVCHRLLSCIFKKVFFRQEKNRRVIGELETE